MWVSDSPVGMTKHGFNALNSDAVGGKSSVRRLKPAVADGAIINGRGLGERRNQN